MKFNKAVEIIDYEWRIRNFRRDVVGPMTQERYLANRKITVNLGNNETKWSLRFFIKNTEVSLLLCLLDAESRDFKTKFSCFIPEKSVNYKRSLPVSDYSEKHASYYQNNITRLKLTDLNEIFDNPTNYFIEYDTLLIKIKIELISGFKLQDIECHECIPSARDFFYEFHKLYENKMFTDFTIICSDGKEIKAHRCVLAANSPVLSAMLQTQMMESATNKMRIDDIDSEVMGEILNFMYTQGNNPLSFVHLRQIYYGADKYQIAKLKEKCISYIVEFLNVKNVLHWLTMADFYKDNYLMLRCVMLINENHQEVVKDEYWNKLSTSQLDIIKEFMMEHQLTVQRFESTL